MLRSSSALASLAVLAAFALPQPARAADECGTPTGGAVTCTATGNPYAGGISYTPVQDLTLVLDSGVSATNTVSVQGGGAVHITNDGSIMTTGSGTVGDESNDFQGSVGAAGILARGTGIAIDGMGPISTTGTNARGIDATTTGDGGITIAVGDVTTTGAGGGHNGNSNRIDDFNSTAVRADTRGSAIGNITIATGNLSTMGNDSDGVAALAAGGNVTINTGSISTHGIYSDGIRVQDGVSDGFGYDDLGSVSVTASGTITTTGQSADGIDIRADTITVQAGDIHASGDGIVANSFGTGDVTVNFGSITSDGEEFGAGVFAEGSSNTTITGGDITVSGSNALGIDGFGGQVLKIVDTGTITALGAHSGGIAAYDGHIDISANNIHASSYAISVYAPSVNITISGAVSSTEDAEQRHSYPGLPIHQHAGTITAEASDRDGTLFPTEGLHVTVTNNGTVASAGNGVAGIYVSAHNFMTPTLTGGLSATVAGTGSVSTTGDNAAGILAAADGDISITQGNITTSGTNSRGVDATTTGTGKISVDVRAVSTTGVNASGIVAGSDSDDAVMVTAASVSVTGTGSIGIQATGAGTVSVTSGAASAHDSPSIVATSSGGAASVTLNGATTTGSGQAVLVTGATSAILNLDADGSLTSAGGGATLTLASSPPPIQASAVIRGAVEGSPSAIVNNAGTITGDGTTPIVTAIGGPLTFNNGGRFTGLIGFTDGDDSVANSGTYTALYDQDFGAGTDSFANSGTLAVLHGASTASTVHFTGLESFANGGLIDLRNGHTGDVLSLSGSFAGSGNSTLAIDNTIGVATDKLVVAGAITGSTQLVIAAVPANGAALGSGSVFATGGAGSSPTAFTLATQFASSGFVRYGIAFDAADESYSLLGAPSDAVFRTLKIEEGARQLWQISADAFASHATDLRDARFGDTGSGARLWGQSYGQAHSRSSTETFPVFGQARAVDLSYKQDAFGAQLGFDLLGTGKGLVVGVTGGYLNSTLNFRNSADRVTYDTVNAGIYASYVSAHLFANLLGKIDYSWIRSASQLAGYTDKFHGKTYGAQGEAGVHFGSDGLYVEPVATIAYVHSDIGDLRALGATIDFDGRDGVRGKAGIRVGAKIDMGGGSTGTIYARGDYVHEFKGGNGIVFSSGGTSLPFRDGALRDYGEGKIGFTVTSAGGVSGFVESFGDYSGQYKGGGGRAGLRVSF